MLRLYALVGYIPLRAPSLCACGSSFLCTMYCLVLRVDFLHSTTILSGISLPLFWLKCVLRSLLSQSCSLLVTQISCLSLLLTLIWILRWMISEVVNLRDAMLMSGSSTLMLPPISVLLYLPLTRSMKTSNIMLMVNRSRRSNCFFYASSYVCHWGVSHHLLQVLFH